MRGDSARVGEEEGAKLAADSQGVVGAQEAKDVLHGAEEDAAKSNSGILRDLGAEGREKGTERTSSRASVVPVEAEREHSKSLISVGTAEDAGEPGRIASSEAEDGNTGESRGDELCARRRREVSENALKCRTRGTK